MAIYIGYTHELKESSRMREKVQFIIDDVNPIIVEPNADQFDLVCLSLASSQ